MKIVYSSTSSLLLVVVVTTQVVLVRAQNPGPCTLCIDGSTPPFLNNPVFDFQASDSTCADFVAAASAITVEDMETFLACRQLQDVGLSNCGCETPEELKTGCTLCPGGNELLPDPLKEVIPQVTCSGIASVVERFEGDECRAYQQVIGGMCDCPDAPTTKNNGDETCRICMMDREVDFPAAPVDLSDFGLDAVPCAFFETIANEDNETSCEIFQLSRASCCEMPSVAPAPPSNLAELCATDTITNDLEAYLVCANLCIDATCCLSTCITSPTCFQYLPCGVLDTIDPPEPDDIKDGGGSDGNSTSSGPPVPPDDLAELCKEDTISNDLDAYLECLAVCAPAECCLGTCFGSPNCFQYFACSILDGMEPPGPGDDDGNSTTDGGPPVPPDNLAELCKADTIANNLEAYSKCLDVCEPAQCCLDTCFGVPTCFQYFACTVLDGMEPPQAGTNGPTSSGGGNGSGSMAPNSTTGTTVPVGNATTAPTAAEGKDESGANGDSGLFVSFRLVLSILLTMAAVAVAEWGV